MTANDQNGSKVQSKWGDEMGIAETTTQEVSLFSSMGWALDNYGKPRQLSNDEKKMIALACHNTGLSVMGKQIMYLGNSLYVTKSGKISVSRRDKERPLHRIKVRPATEEERTAYGTIHNKPNATETRQIKTRNGSYTAEVSLYEHLWYAEIHAKIDDKVEIVSDAFGHACIDNIRLNQKEKDPRRLCADMASTRAVSRALTQAYDFFGIESYEEVALRAEPIDVSYEEVDPTEKTDKLADELSEQAGTDEGEQVSMKAVQKLRDENKDLLPTDKLTKFNDERLAGLTADGLRVTSEEIKELIDEAKKASGGHESTASPEDAVPESEKTAATEES